MRVLVCGSRDWGDGEAIAKRLQRLALETPVVQCPITIVHGACSRKVGGIERSADMLADYWARRCGFAVEQHLAEWGRFGRRAGAIRNVRMAKSGIGLVLAFQRNDSRGTQHTIDEARRRGIPVEVHADR